MKYVCIVPFSVYNRRLKDFRLHLLTMSEAFRCDGCDEYYGGQPTEIRVCMAYSGISSTIILGHAAGRDDAHPDPADKHKVEWPWHSGTVQFCAECTANEIVPAMQRLARRGRYE